MNLSIFTNPASQMANRSMTKANAELTKAMNRLGSGKRVNSGADDAAGMQIAARLEAESRGLTVARRNISDATTMLQTAEGTFTEMTGILNRMKDLVTQSKNETNTEADVDALNKEFMQLGEEFGTIMRRTRYSGEEMFGSELLGKSGGLTLQIGAGSKDTMKVNIGAEIGALTRVANNIAGKWKEASGTTPGDWEKDFRPINIKDSWNGGGHGGISDASAPKNPQSLIDGLSNALNSVGQVRGALGSYINRLEYTANNVVNLRDNTDIAIGNIMDADFAAESTRMTRNQVLMQTSMGMLKNANGMAGMVAGLIG